MPDTYPEMAGPAHAQHPRSGEIVSRYDFGEAPGGLLIDRADTFVVISGELMRNWQCEISPWVTLDDTLLTIAATNMTVTYRIAQLPCGCWVATKVDLDDE